MAKEATEKPTKVKDSITNATTANCALTLEVANESSKLESGKCPEDTWALCNLEKCACESEDPLSAGLREKSIASAELGILIIDKIKEGLENRGNVDHLAKLAEIYSNVCK